MERSVFCGSRLEESTSFSKFKGSKRERERKGMCFLTWFFFLIQLVDSLVFLPHEV